MAHTPTPWSIRVTGLGREIEGPNHEDIGYLNASDGADEPEMYDPEANGRLIVRAVNSFEAMREALENLRRAAACLEGSPSIIGEIRAAREALALANKEPS